MNIIKQIIPRNRKYVPVYGDGHCLFRALLAAQTGRVTEDIEDVKRMRKRIAESIIAEPSAFFVHFFAHFMDNDIQSADMIREIIIRETFRTDSAQVQDFINLVNALGRKLRRHTNLYNESHDTYQKFLKSVQLYARMMASSSNAWGGPIEIQAFANMTGRPVAVYLTLQKGTIHVYLPFRAYPIEIQHKRSNNATNLYHYTRVRPEMWHRELPKEVVTIVFSGRTANEKHYDALVYRPPPQLQARHPSSSSRKRKFTPITHHASSR